MGSGFKFVTMCGLLLTSGGCSLFRPAQQSVMISTTPVGVPLRVDGTERGPSPVTLQLNRNESHTIVATTQGAIYTRELNPKLSAAGTLDIVGASVFLVPGVGLLSPGAWDLDTMNVILHLESVPQAATLPASEPVPTAGEAAP